MRTLTCILCGIICSGYTLFAQSSPIQPEQEPQRHYLGMILGLGQNIQLGDAYVDCPSAIFTGGTKFGYSLGLLYEYTLSEKFTVGVSATYNSHGIDATFTETEPCSIDYVVNGVPQTTVANISFKNDLAVDLGNIAIAPYIKWNPWKFMFLRVGVAVGTNVSTSLIHTKTVAQRTVRLPNGEIWTVKVDGEPTLQDSEVLEAVSPQIYIQPALGFNIPFSEKLIFSPIFEYGIPLENVSDWGDNFKVSTWRINFELRLQIAKKHY